MSTPTNDPNGLPEFTEYAAGHKVEATYHGADDDARAEAERRWPGQVAMFGLEHTTAARAFVAGAEWQASRTPVVADREVLIESTALALWDDGILRPELAHEVVEWFIGAGWSLNPVAADDRIDGALIALIREHHRVEVEMGQPGSPAVLLGHIGDLLRIIDTPSPVVADVDREAVRHALWDFPENVITLDDLDAKADTGDLDYAETREYLNQQADAVLALLRGEPRGN